MATKTKTRTAKAAYAAVMKSAESIRNADAATIETVSAGDVVRQGDVYVIALDSIPAMASAYPGRQLAPGNTQGSRHTAQGECELFTPVEQLTLGILGRLIPASKGQQHFLGPVVKAAAPWTIAHPEHGDRTLPAGTYLVTYQRAWAQEMRRQAD